MSVLPGKQNCVEVGKPEFAGLHCPLCAMNGLPSVTLDVRFVPIADKGAKLTSGMRERLHPQPLYVCDVRANKLLMRVRTHDEQPRSAYSKRV